MKRWRTTYIILANTAILMWVALIATHGIVRAVEYLLPTDRAPALTSAAANAYRHMALADVRELRRLSWALGFRYETVVGSVPAPIASRFINVDAYGIRANGTTPRDISSLDGAVWMLGGSTTFGFGVMDHETIPAQLEATLGRPVINLGVSGFASGDENRWLNHYLRVGYRPAMALFLDGINETCDPDIFRDDLSVLVELAQQPYTWEIGKPVTYAAHRFGGWLARRMGRAPVRSQGLQCDAGGKRNTLRTIHARYMVEREALCALYRIECTTFVQPFAGLHAELQGHPAEDLEEIRTRAGNLFTHLAPSWKDAGSVFLTDVLRGADGYAFVDDAHYSAEASRIIAAAIARQVTASAARQGRPEP